MTLDRSRVMLIGGAVFTLLVTGYKLWPSGSKPARPVAAASAAAQPGVAAVAPPPPPPPLSRATLNTWARLPQSTRDPFFTVAEIDAMNRPPIVSRPVAAVPTVPPPPLPVYTLKMIMTAGSERLASIDGRVVKVGDTIGSERVVQILPDAVILDRGGERRRLLLSSNDLAPGRIRIERVR